MSFFRKRPTVRSLRLDPAAVGQGGLALMLAYVIAYVINAV